MPRLPGVGLSVLLTAAALTGVPHAVAQAATVPAGFQEQIVFAGLDRPTNVEFAADGRVFVAEKGGVIKVYDSVADSSPTVFADLSDKVNDVWDRGLLGLALHPSFPAQPWVYVLYSYDAPPGQTAPYWHDDCSSVVGGDTGGNCVITGRLSRLQANGNVMTGSEQVLIGNAWCQQYPSHSVGDLKFGADGMLYASSGDGASFADTDYGQFGEPANPCGDPALEGGSLRSQDVRSDQDPAGLNGTVLRLDPVTGLGAPGNPYAASPDVNKRRVAGLGLRNPFRFTMRPGTSEPWFGDVGGAHWEELNRLPDPLAANPSNFGWPCFEGRSESLAFDLADLPMCESLFSGGAVEPYYTYHHNQAVAAGENCSDSGDDIAGLAFYPHAGGSYPAAYGGALFFADHARGCIFAMKTGGMGGLPDPGNIEAFVQTAAAPVDLAIGPGDELYYVDFSGTVRRIRYFQGNQPPIAAVNANPLEGVAPFGVHFDASASYDSNEADVGRLTYQWDFTNDGSYDATGVTADTVYPAQSTYTARVRVTDTLGAFDEETLTVYAQGFAPTPVIDTPTSLTAGWTVGDVIGFSGHANDPESGPVSASALTWQLRMRHCSSTNSCHTHIMQSWNGVAAGSFIAPDHEYPSYLELALTAQDPTGRTSTVVRQLNPQTVTLAFASRPAGIPLSVGGYYGYAPFSIQVIKGSSRTMSAPATRDVGANTYAFFSWSDLGARTHVVHTDTPKSTQANYFKCGGWYRFLRPRECAPPAPLGPRRIADWM